MPTNKTNLPANRRIVKEAVWSRLLAAQFETSPDGILVVNPEGKILAHNTLFGKMWLIPKTVLATNDDKELLMSATKRLKNPAKFLEKVQSLYQQKHQRSFDRIELKDGRIFSRYSSPIYDEGEKYFGRIWYFRDITQETKSQQKAIVNDVKFKTIFKSTADPIFILDEYGRFVEVNDAACRQSGYTRRQLLKMSALDINSPATRPTILEKLALVKQKGVGVFETEHVTKSGKAIPVEIHSHVMTVNNRKLMVAICRDMRKNFRIRDLKRLAIMGEKKFKTVFDSAGDAIFILPGENVYNKKFIEVNRTACKKLGYDHNELLEMTPNDLEILPFKKNLTRILSERTTRIKSQGVLFLQLKMRAKNGQAIPFELISRRANYYGQAVLVCVARDITDVQKVRELQELKTIQDEFLNITTHELRTPLTSIIGLSEIIDRENGSLSSQERRYINIIHEEAERLARTIKQILEVTRYEHKNIPINKTEFKIGDFVNSLEPILKSIAHDRNDKIAFKVGVCEQTVKSDQEKISQVIFDLVDNAVKFGPDEQTIKIIVSGPKNNEVAVKVVDQGPGIAKAKQSEIFKKFGQLDTSFSRSQEGIGLGLYIAKMIVEELGGKIGVTSKVGKGSAFWFTLPIK
jgi:PAS domain S-box-containing protein